MKQYRRKPFMLLLLTMFSLSVNAQGVKKFDVYKPQEDAAAVIKKAVNKASQEKKHVLIQVGGNWCSWCARFYDFTTKDTQIDSLLDASFVVYHLNYSKENKNLQTLTQYAFPQRFGFPVFLILDGEGKLIHTQNSAYLEEGKGYSKEKIIDFLNAWTVQALDPEKYKDGE